MANELESILTEGFAALGLSLDGEALARFRRYYEILSEKNRVMNLTAIEGEADSARLHFLDCAALLNFTDFTAKRVIDVGSGAGFPGLVLKIARPETDLTLLDSLDKRVKFLRETSADLGFEGLRCVHARAEEPPEGFRQGFDIVVSRAVARLNVLCELCLPFAKTGGVFLAMKGPGAAEELSEAKKAVRLLGGQIEHVEEYRIPGTDLQRTVIRIRKVSDTPARYPRRWAQIKKAPL